MLMWTHYAGQHSGICLEFSRESILNAFWLFFPVIYDKPIAYSDILRKGAGHFKYLDKNLLKQYLYKTKDWSYEKEWRAVLSMVYECEKFSEDTKGFLSREIVPSRIFLGSNMCESDKNFIKKVVEEKNQSDKNISPINIVKMKIKEDKWEFEPYE